MRVFSPMWFRIKTKSSCKDGSTQAWHQIHLSRYLSTKMRNIVDPVIKKKGYFGRPENILFAMISDDRKHIRELEVCLILKARTQQSTEIRLFKVPKLNFDAGDYVELVNWQNNCITEPPLTIHISEIEMKLIVANGASQMI